MGTRSGRTAGTGSHNLTSSQTWFDGREEARGRRVMGMISHSHDRTIPEPPDQPGISPNDLGVPRDGGGTKVPTFTTPRSTAERTRSARGIIPDRDNHFCAVLKGKTHPQAGGKGFTHRLNSFPL